MKTRFGTCAHLAIKVRSLELIRFDSTLEKLIIPLEVQFLTVNQLILGHHIMVQQLATVPAQAIPIEIIMGVHLALVRSVSTE